MSHKLWLIVDESSRPIRSNWKFEFQDIDQLQNHGINAADLNKACFHILFSHWSKILANHSVWIFLKTFKLKAAGILTIKGVKMSTKKKLRSVFMNHIRDSWILIHILWLINYESFLFDFSLVNIISKNLSVT